jgi:hypothetical protein
MWYRLFKKAVRVLTEPEITAHQTPSMYEYPAFTIDPDIAVDPTSELGAKSKVWGPGQYTSQNRFVQQGYYGLVGKNPKPPRKRKKGQSPRPQGAWNKQNKTRWERLPRGTKIINNDNVPHEHAKIILDKMRESSDVSSWNIDELEKKISINEVIKFNELKGCLRRDKEIFPLLIALGYDALEYTPYERSSVKRLPNESQEDYDKRVEKQKNAGKNVLIFNRALLVIPRIFTKSRLRPDLLTVEEIDLLQKEMYQSSEDILKVLIDSDAFRNAGKLSDEIISMIVNKGEKLEDYPNLNYVPLKFILKSLENGSTNIVFNKAANLSTDEAKMLIDDYNVSAEDILSKVRNVDIEFIDKMKGILVNLEHSFSKFSPVFKTLEDVKYAVDQGWQPKKYSYSTDTIDDSYLLKNYVPEENWHLSFDQFKGDLSIWKTVFDVGFQYSYKFDNVFPNDSVNKIPCEIFKKFYPDFKYTSLFRMNAFQNCPELAQEILNSSPDEFKMSIPSISDVKNINDFEKYYNLSMMYIQKYPDDDNFKSRFEYNLSNEFEASWRGLYFNDISYDMLKIIFSQGRKQTKLYALVNYRPKLIPYIINLFEDNLINEDELKYVYQNLNMSNDIYWKIIEKLNISLEQLLKDIYMKEEAFDYLVDRFKDDDIALTKIVESAFWQSTYNDLNFHKKVLALMAKLNMPFSAPIVSNLKYLKISLIDYLDLLKSFGIKMESWTSNYMVRNEINDLSDEDKEIVKEKLESLK